MWGTKMAKNGSDTYVSPLNIFYKHHYIYKT